MDLPLDGVALRSGFLASEACNRAGLDRFLEELDCYEIEDVQLKKMMLEKDPTIRAASTCLLEIEKKVATIETGKEALLKLIAELLAFVSFEWVSSTHNEIFFLKLSFR